MNRNPLNAPTRAFRSGEVIFREGDSPADEAFMIHIGRVEVRKQVGAVTCRPSSWPPTSCWPPRAGGVRPMIC